jgi:hypothetical protein
MAAADDLDKVIEQYDKALGEFVKGNPEPVKKLFSHRDYVTLSLTLFSLSDMDGRRLLRGWKGPHRISEMARSLATRL